MEQLTLTKRDRLNGTVTVPGSKSISNRYLLLSALAHGTTVIENLLESDDTERMQEALLALGIMLSGDSLSGVTVEGGKGSLPGKNGDLFLGNAGTAFRSLTAALALNGGDYQLRGIPRMHERPIKDLVTALNTIGAKIDYLENEGYPPLAIKAGNITGDRVTVKGDVSSQYLTALLMALPMIGREFTIQIDGELISKPYITITLKALEQFGIRVINHNFQSFTIPAGSRYLSPNHLFVEGDASSASYFLAAGAIAGEVTVKGVGKSSIQGDVKFAHVLEMMGAEVTWNDHSITVKPPRNGELKGLDLDCNDIPDAAMTLATLALYANGKTRLRNIASWRVKETDRIDAMATELRKLGVTVETGPDFIEITPQATLTPNVAIETYDDHRIAMCFSLCAFKTDLIILDPACVNKTFPTYFELFESISER
ncbi:3-phosphoshikimate 1-carboxyvinyltransferase [Ignatzschineria sp. RMDPL8A]|uniref:3-phosphoshikimate 1-carboxyvinyltransferase n=1 Tax=Ignatzschineria sp. RMDPL8A TaxID=2999236 RepID=UPI00244676B4|nr:3-phosphoshikimate 1-carboxyvinyltransferase [Ignatzschineria sp. RMDPL8A]MDG9729139.1 3-phosphoshikimate 1-carboxyvinyltransferase [Ignatzschineria sp. RMDPL8A]